jgi:hypothetical protein
MMMMMIVIMILMISIRRRTRRRKMGECSKKQDIFLHERKKYRFEMPLAVIALPSGNARLHVRKGVGRWKR